MNNDTSSNTPESVRTQCGTRRGMKLHRKHKERPCEPCYIAERFYQKEFRKKKFVPFEQRTEPTSRPSCGSPRGSDLHAYHGELSCEPCRLAGNKRVVDYDTAHPEARERRSKGWHLENPELSRAAGKKWRDANPEKVAAKNRKRRALKLNLPTELYTADDVLNKWGSDCHICGLAVNLEAPRHPRLEGWEFGLQLDHVIPIALGGYDVLENVKPSHGICNFKKGTA